MYKNVLNQRIVALFLWFSSCYSFFLTETQPIKALLRRLTLILNWYLNQYLLFNQFSATHNILNNTSI